MTKSDQIQKVKEELRFWEHVHTHLGERELETERERELEKKLEELENRNEFGVPKY